MEINVNCNKLRSTSACRSTLRSKSLPISLVIPFYTYMTQVHLRSIIPTATALEDGGQLDAP